MVIEHIVPATVAVTVTYGDRPATSTPGEEQLVANASPERRREFATTRWCAREAMATLGIPRQPVLTGSNRAPLWPRGIVGSLTHCRGYRAAAIARTADAAALGIDAERHAPLPNGVAAMIARAEELRHLEHLPTGPTCWDTLLFSAKESVYKAWQPLTGYALDFLDASITIDPADNIFDAYLHHHHAGIDGAPSRLRGRWIVRAGLIATAVALSPSAPV